MKFSLRTGLLLLCIMIASTLLVLAWPDGAGAETMVIVEPSSTGGLLVSAGNLSGVTAGEIRLDYAIDGLAIEPSVDVLGNNTKASLLRTSGNTGTVVINITGRKPVSGYYYLARINLMDQDGNQGRIVPPYFAQFTKSSGGRETASVAVTNPTAADKKPDQAKTIEEKRAALADAKNKRQQEQAERSQVAPNNDTSDSTERPRETVVLVASSSQHAPAPSPKFTPPVFRRVEGVLDRFRGYQGEWTPVAAERLFAPVVDTGFQQHPGVLISDGVSEAHVAVRSAKEGESINCFVIRGGHVNSVQQGDAGEWLLNIVPGRGAQEVTVTMQTGQTIVEYPLTVAPPLNLFAPESPKTSDRYLIEFVTMANQLAARNTAVVETTSVMRDTTSTLTP